MFTDIERLVMLCGNELNLQPLYPYPDNPDEYMNVNETSYKYVYDTDKADLLKQGRPSTACSYRAHV